MMNRRILRALQTLADFQDAERVHKAGITTSRHTEECDEIHRAVLELLTTEEKERYHAIHTILCNEPDEQKKAEIDPDKPHCDEPGCTSDVKKICRCARCEQEGSEYSERFYVCNLYSHMTSVTAKHERMRTRPCVWFDLPPGKYV